MIHELIDTKKKLVKNNETKGTKTLADFSSKSCYDSNIGICDHSDSENKGASSTSNTFIPPWLKNSLGLSQRNKQNLDWNVCLPNFTALGHAVSDQKSSKTIPKYKEQEKNDSDNLRANIEPDCTIRVTCNDLDQISLSDNFHCSSITKYQNLGVRSIHRMNEKEMTPLWNETFKDNDYRSVCAKSEMKLPQWEDAKATYNNENNLGKVNEEYKEDEKKKPKSSKLKNKIKKNNLNDGDPCSELNKNRMDDVSKSKVKGGQGNCSKKDGHSFNVDIKEIEAKPIYLDAKCRETDISKLNQQEFCLLREIKEQTVNKVKFEKLINHIRESNLKESLKPSDDSFKINVEKIKVENNAKEKLQNLPFLQGESVKANSDKDSLKSTDEENDIKRFSEFLSKNKNVDEKKKCLEEVRNYFERKRRTRLTKRRFQDEFKLGKCDNNNFTIKKDDLPRERPAPRDLSGCPAKEKKSKFVPCNEEVVEKAVSETLQKFMNLYHFQVSPTIIRSMRKNILEAIQSDSLDSNLSKKNGVVHQEPPLNSYPQTGKHSDVNFEGRKAENLSNGLKDGESYSTNEKRICSKNSASAFFGIPETAMTLDSLPSADFKESKKIFFKTLVDDNKESGFKSNRENDVLENENFRRLKREFENCLKSVQFHADGTGLKIQSLVLEKEETTASKGIRFVYNFSKKSLELIQLDSDQVRSNARGTRDGKRSKNGETQTFFKLDTIKRSMKCQTVAKTEVRDQSLQTEVKMLTTNYAQTEVDCNSAREVKEIKSIDISPGLYRMVKSKDAGRFYLYPEKEEDLKSRYFQNTTTDSFESKCNQCESRSGKNFIRSKKFIFSERSGKDTRVLQRNRYRGKGMKRTKKKITLENGLSKFSKEESVESKVHTSISCLFFRNGKSQKEGETNGGYGKDDSVSLVDDEIQKNAESHSYKDDRFGCFLFWNGERIGPGCDLKTHVETLLKEKLNEIKMNAENRLEMDTNKNIKIVDADKMTRNENFEKDLCPKSNAAVICFRKDYSSKMKILRRVALPDTSDTPQDLKRRKDKAPSVVNVSGALHIKKEKFVRDVGTQNSSNEIPWLKNKSKKKSVSKTSTGSKISGKRWKRFQGSKGEGFGLGMEELVNFVKVVRNIKRFRKEAYANKALSPESSFGEGGGCTSTFSAENNNLNYWRDSVTGTKSKTPKIPSWENLRPNNNSEDHRQEMQGSKHWELIDSLLNKVPLKEKQSLWNDMRQLIKGKLGRDIDEEGAKEVCIEIEQDVPRSKTGKLKHAVVARGHYVKSEGDVEVEIDLTMGDLERILRQRHKKMWRKRHRRPIYNLSKGKKLASSSSTRSGYTSK